MAEHYEVVIIGSGPAGLSAAARCAEIDAEEERDFHSHILLESYSLPSQTIQQYQKGKYVMAEPGYLDLRSDLEFEAGSRENILGKWEEGIEEKEINIRYGAEVEAITGPKGDFKVQLKNGDWYTAANIVLAIGINGNPRKMGVDGDDPSDFVQYTLSDPEEFHDETIVVIGAGDSAIENALALSKNNHTIIVNRRAEFSRAKEGNLNAVLGAINDKHVKFDCFYSSSVKGVELPSSPGERGKLILNTPEGDKEVPCHRIIARLGAIPPRRFVESCGIEFPNEKEDAIPELSATYESNKPGIYVIGSLAGFPLIKQAMNQGYEVIEFIHGNMIKPADHPIIEQQFSGVPYEKDVDEMLSYFQTEQPLFGGLNALTFRELIIESKIIVAYPDGAPYKEAHNESLAMRAKVQSDSPGSIRSTSIIKEGGYIFQQGDYSSTFYTIIRGDVHLIAESGEVSESSKDKIHDINKLKNVVISLGAGEAFGEMSLLSGQPRTTSAIAGKDLILLETPRRMVVKLMNSNEDLNDSIQWIFHIRALRRYFESTADSDDIRVIAEKTDRLKFEAGENIFTETDEGETMHLIRTGTVTLRKEQEGRSIMVGQSRPGQVVGEMAVLGNPVRQESAFAAVRVETIAIKQPEFAELIKDSPGQMEQIQKRTSNKLIAASSVEAVPQSGDIMSFLMNEGLGEATNALIIDKNLCIGCDNCEKACAETHHGISRLDRKTGAAWNSVHIPVSCRHCELPHCMKDCPPNAIQRSNSGEVFIDPNTCIGCGNCESNCPYDVIKLVYTPPPKPSFWRWMFFGAGPGPGEERNYKPSDEDKAKGKKAVKCDACMSDSGGPACVRSCPTGAAIRLGPENFNDLALKKS